MITKYRTVRIEKNGKLIAWRVFQIDQFGTNVGDISDHETERGARNAIKRYIAGDNRRQRQADKVDGYDRDDLGDSPDY